MPFYLGKVEHHHGWPSFDFITDKKQRYIVFPKEKSFKTWDEQDRATSDFFNKLHGPAKAKNLGNPFATPLWHQYKDHFDVIPAQKLQEYKKERVKKQDEEGEQLNMFDAVKTASEREEQLKSLRRIMDLRQHKTAPRPPKIELPKKGPGSYKRDKKIDL